MSMYLSNSAVQPTGFEPGEFLEVPDRLPREVGPDAHGARNEAPLGGPVDGTPSEPGS